MARILSFDCWYELLANYYECYGETEINYYYRTFDGFNYDNKGYNLGMWVHTIRNKYKKQKLSSEQIEKLEKINFRFENNYHTLEWERMYLLAVSYYNYYGNTMVPVNFKTLNGYEYDENGDNLTLWFSRQRELYRNNMLDDGRYRKLSKIGFVVWRKGDVSDKQILCKKFGIDYYKYSFLISIITYKEFCSKIYYLLDNRYEIVDDKGNINRIFFMNSDRLKMNIGFTTEELIEYYSCSYMNDLIDEYYLGKSKKKSLNK